MEAHAMKYSIVRTPRGTQTHAMRAELFIHIGDVMCSPIWRRWGGQWRYLVKRGAYGEARTLKEAIVRWRMMG